MSRKWWLLVGFVLVVGLIHTISMCHRLRIGCDHGETVRVDTVTVVAVDTVYLVQEVTKRVTRWDTVYRDTVWVNTPQPPSRGESARSEYVLVNRYIDSVAMVTAMLHYNLAVTGELYSADFRLTNKVPQINRTITNTITKEITRYPAGLFATVSFNTGMGPGIGAFYIPAGRGTQPGRSAGRWAYGYEYGLNKTHTARIGFRLIGR